MKKLFTLFAVFAALTLQVSATKHTITISGFTYSPLVTTAQVGDTVTISGSTFHPLVQVSKASWDLNDATPLPGGWGTKTAAYTFVVSTMDTVYFVCAVHVTLGMKGKVAVAPTQGIDQHLIPVDEAFIFPNPMSDNGIIKYISPGNSIVSVYIFDIGGQMEMDLTSSGSKLGNQYEYQFDAGRIPVGTHFVMITSDRDRVVRKFDVIR